MALTVKSSLRWGDLTGNVRAVAVTTPAGAKVEDVSKLITRGVFEDLVLNGSESGPVKYALIPYLYDHDGILRLDGQVYEATVKPGANETVSLDDLPYFYNAQRNKVTTGTFALATIVAGGDHKAITPIPAPAPPTPPVVAPPAVTPSPVPETAADEAVETGIPGADPTGKEDSTAAIQAAIDEAAKNINGGKVYLPAGIYKVSFPFLELKPHVTVVGDGSSTWIVATADKAVTEKTGVFHTGTYNTKKTDPKLFRFGVENLFITSRAADGQHHDPIPNVCGIVFNTFLQENPADPDAVPTLKDVEIWGMDEGVALLGLDDQGMKVYNLRIRRTLGPGIIVGKPKNHPEGTGGAADNKFICADVSSANLGKRGAAGIEIYTSQTKFVASTSWYNKRYRPWQDIYGLATPQLNANGQLAAARVAMGAEMTAGASRNRQWQHDGAGWYIRSTKNIFSACTAQENGGHGWVVEYSDNQLAGVLGESSSYTGCVHDAAAVNEAADFYICNDAQRTTITNLRAESARGSNTGARFGVYVEPYANEVAITGGLAQKQTTAPVFLGKDFRGTTRIEVNGVFYGNPDFKPVVQGAFNYQVVEETERSHPRRIVPVTYFYADHWQPVDKQKWHQVGLAGDVVPFVIINPKNGPSKRGDDDYKNFARQVQIMRDEFGLKIYGYVRTGASIDAPRPEADILKEVDEYVAQYGVDGIFGDEYKNGWGAQAGASQFHRSIYNKIRGKYPFLKIVGNPGASIAAEMKGTADIFMTYENDAASYLTAKDLTQEHYKGMSRHAFWHTIHDVKNYSQAVQVLQRADTVNVANLYLTDDTIYSGAERNQNPYDSLPSTWLWNLQLAWARGTLTEYMAQVETVRAGHAIAKAAGVTAAATELAAQYKKLTGDDIS